MSTSTITCKILRIYVPANVFKRKLTVNLGTKKESTSNMSNELSLSMRELYCTCSQYMQRSELAFIQATKIIGCFGVSRLCVSYSGILARILPRFRINEHNLETTVSYSIILTLLAWLERVNQETCAPEQ